MTLQFAAPVTLPAGSYPQAAALIDMNGDGILDLVVADDGTQSVGVLLGDGKGEFGYPIYSAAGANLVSIATLDLNGDGLPDLVGVSDYGSNTVTTLLNNGHNGFTIGVSYAVGLQPSSVAVADLNGDGLPDLVVANSTGSTVSVLLNNGHGGFATAISLAIPVGTDAISLTTYDAVVADVTGDGKPDIIVVDYRDGLVDVLPGNGHGGFGAPVSYKAAMDPIAVAVADLNGDGRPDIITGSGIGGQVSILLSNASGGFAAPVNYSTVPDVASIAVADLNGDGHPDLVVGGNVLSAISVLLNDGTGHFLPQTQLATGAAPEAVLAADLTGNGDTDIVTANFGSNTATVFLNTAPSTTATVHAPHSADQVAVGVDGLVTLTSAGAAQSLGKITQINFTDGTAVIDATGAASEVARLYGAAFGRAADVAGLDGFTAAIDQGTLTLTGTAALFIQSGEFTTRYGTLSHQGLVEQFYQNTFNRPGDAAGVQGWTAALDAGASVGTVLLGFSDSQESKDLTRPTIGDKDQSEAYRLYQAAFNRTPDTTGLDGWTAALDAGSTPLAVAKGFTQSAEFGQLYGGLSNDSLVDALYQNALHRAGDAVGRTGWINALNAGASRAQVVLGFSDSAENRIGTAPATHDGWVFVPH